MFTSVYAPFTDEQVSFLAAWQDRGPTHPFTCPNRGEGHSWPEGARDLGLLVPTSDGWFCPGCSYVQDWAYDFMLSMPPTFEDLFGTGTS